MQKRRHGPRKLLGSVQTSESIMRILENSLSNADEEQEKLEDQLAEIRRHTEELQKIVYQPYLGIKDEEIPTEFKDPQNFLSTWDKLDRALGNTILMVMPPQIFQATANPTEKTEKNPQSQVVILNKEKEEHPVRMPVKGFLSGFHDVRIARLEIEAKTKLDEKPTITTEKVTYDPKAIVYQLIPSLNEIKQTYFSFLQRHLSYNTPSFLLLKHGHEVLQEEMSKYFDVVNPFCNASIIHQKEKIRGAVLQQIISISRIAQAEAIARAYQQPFIPNEVRAMMRAMQEGKIFNIDGFKVPSSDQIVKRKRETE